MNKLTQNVLLLFIINFVAFVQIFAQNQDEEYIPKMRAGLFGGITYVQNQADIPLIPFLYDCGNFEDGDDIAFHIGVNCSYDFFNKFLVADIRAFYESRPASLQASRSPYEVLNPTTNQYENIVIDHEYEGQLQYLALDIGGKITPYHKLPFYYRLGFDIGSAIIGNEVLNYEQISSPEGVLFPDQTLRRINEDGQIPNTQMVFGISNSIGYQIEFDNGMIITPEIEYRFPLNSIRSDIDWNQQIIRAKLGVSWYIDKKKKERAILPEPDLPVQEPEIIEEEVVVDIIKPQIKKFTIGEIKLKETIVTQTYPILNYIFFEEGKSVIKDKYLSKVEKDKFSEQDLPKSTLDIYYRVLDIIGNRLKNSKSKITLTGTSDGKELNNEDERLSLAQKRAEAVKDYFVDLWGIEGDRIIIRQRLIPNLPTNTKYNEGYEENRRVELTSNDNELFHPVVHKNFFEYASNQKSVNAQYEVSEIEKLGNGNIYINSPQLEIIKNIDIIKVNDEVNINIDQNNINSFGKALENNEEIYAEFKAEDLSVQDTRNIIEKRTKIKINKSTNQYEIGRLNLIVFDFDKSVISQSNKQMLEEFVSKAIQENSTVEIIGSTDRLGEKQYNEELSLSRAESVAEFIKSINPNVKIENVEGIGASKIEYDNNMPEGRFYCRTVLVEVKTPIKK